MKSTGMKSTGMKNTGMEYAGLKNTRWIALLSLVALLAVGCEQKGPAERAGERIDDTAEEISDSARDVGNRVEDACEDLKKEAGAEDTDC